jgi:hypothetical protein
VRPSVSLVSRPQDSARSFENRLNSSATIFLFAIFLSLQILR